MTELAKNEVVEVELDDVRLPDCVIQDKYSPVNDDYRMRVHRLRREIANHCTDMSAHHVDICKQYMAGLTHKQNGEAHDMTEAGIRKVLQRDDSKHLIFLLNLMRETVDGPNREQRFHLLWRIAVDNEKISPKDAVNAVKEMNAMVGDSKGSGNLTIIMNNPVLAATALDK